MKINAPARSALYEGTTYEGAPARKIDAEAQLRRTMLACMLWEDEAYEDGQSIAARIAALIPLVAPEKVSALAIEARTQMYLRHAPLLIVREMARASKEHRAFVADTLDGVIQRADELSEFLALYWKEKKQPLSAQVKKGLARAITKFDDYQLAKYNQDKAVRLRDVLFLTHAKPSGEKQIATFKALASKTLAVPDTWEVAISALGKAKPEEKRAEWTRLLVERKLGSLALIRNLRNMIGANVDDTVISAALRESRADRVLPFRFLAAVRHAPRFASELETMMLRNLEGQNKLLGKTVVLVDVSGSMKDALSARSDMQRVDAACGLAVLARELCETAQIFSFSDRCVEVPTYRGLALSKAVYESQAHSSTYLGKALDHIHASTRYDRIIVITDEQSHDRVGAPKAKGYLINVASAKNGVGYGPWVHIDGWSDAVLRYIGEYEKTADSKV